MRVPLAGGGLVNDSGVDQIEPLVDQLDIAVDAAGQAAVPALEEANTFLNLDEITLSYRQDRSGFEADVRG